MLRVLADHNFDQRILRGLLRIVPTLDVVTAFQAGLSRAEDPDVLIWAEQEQRLIFTHDGRTMPAHSKVVMEAGHTIAGVVIVSDSLPISKVIEDLELIVTCSQASEWQNVVLHLPL